MTDELEKLRGMGWIGQRIADNILFLPMRAEIDRHLAMTSLKRGSRR